MVSLLYSVSTALGCTVCWLEDMVVHPEERGTGLGTRLLQRAVSYAKDRGAGRISLLTDADNRPAKKLYKRAGFEESTMTTLRLMLPEGNR